MATRRCVVVNTAGAFLMGVRTDATEAGVGESWSSEYPDATLYSRTAARRLVKLLLAKHGAAEGSVSAIEDYGTEDERRV